MTEPEPESDDTDPTNERGTWETRFTFEGKAEGDLLGRVH